MKNTQYSPLMCRGAHRDTTTTGPEEVNFIESPSPRTSPSSLARGARRCLAIVPGSALCGALLVALTGCTTYVEHQSPRTVYLPPPAQPPPSVSYISPPTEGPAVAVSVEAPVVAIQVESDFYEPLSAHGRWEVVGSYGRCWVPARVDAGWRPYCNGYWRRSDAGWYWASDEPWGWATYHYGRWDFSVGLGWFWVPHTQWAPAWVSWRQGAGYVGWAPLPPAARIGARGIVEVRETVVAPRAYVFVSEQRLLEPVRPTTVIVNNTTVVNQTVNITKIQVVNKTVINEGPRPEVIERRSGRKIDAVPVRELRRKEETEVVARQPHIPSAVTRSGQQQGRTEPVPAMAVPARDARNIENPAETRKEASPTVKRGEPRGIGEASSSPRSGRSETEAPARNVGKTQGERAVLPSESNPRTAATRPMPSAQKDEVRTPANRQPSGAPARPELAKPLGHERQRELDRAQGTVQSDRPAPGTKSTQPPGGKQVEKRKEKTAGGEKGRKNTKIKGEEKKDKEQETPLPQRSAEPQPPR